MYKIFENWRKFLNSKEKTLCIYDFDHTLVHTDARIRLKENRKPIPLEEYETRVKSKGFVDRDEFDFDDYDLILNPKPIKKVVESLKNDIKNDEICYILTARHSSEPILEYLPEILDGKTVPVIAVNSEDYPDHKKNDHEKKSNWIRDKIYEGFRKIRFYEDSFENAMATWALKEEFPELELEIFIVTKDGEENHVQSLEELEKYQQIQFKKHPRMKKRLIGMGGQTKNDTFTNKPSMKRSKSAPPGAGGT